MQEMNFDDLTPIEINVSITGKKYVLREASGDAACKYRNALLKSTKLGPDGKPSSIDGMADVEPLLVSLCLFEKTEKGERPVPLLTVRSWPARVQKELFNKVKEISQLDEREETEEQLQKSIEENTKKLEALRAGKEEDSLKNS